MIRILINPEIFTGMISLACVTLKLLVLTHAGASSADLVASIVFIKFHIDSHTTMPASLATRT
jgi:hypothetical protein